MKRDARSARQPLFFCVMSAALVFGAVSCGDTEEATPTIVDSSQTTELEDPAAEPSTTGSATTSSAPASVETTSTVGPSTTPTMETCSAADLPIPRTQDNLPGPVAAMRSEILAAATACDFGSLNELAVASDVPFVHTDVLVEEYQNMPPGEFWRNAESGGSSLLADLVHDLSQPFEIEQHDRLGVIYEWRDPALCHLHDDIQLCRWVVITEVGDWIAFYSESA